MTKLDPRLKRYFRVVPACPQGGVVHHGDCDIYRCGICTCGLLHDLMPSEELQERYPDYAKELGKQEYIIDNLADIDTSVPQISPEEAARELEHLKNLFDN